MGVVAASHEEQTVAPWTELRPNDEHVYARAAQESEIPNFKGSYLGRFPLVSADFGRAIISRNGLEAWMCFP